MLPPPRLPLHLGAKAGEGPRLLRLAGTSRRYLDRPVLQAIVMGGLLGSWATPTTTRTEHQSGNPEERPSCMPRACFSGDKWMKTL